VLWQNTDADVRRQCAVGEGENPSGVNPVMTRCLSDEVLTYTDNSSGICVVRFKTQSDVQVVSWLRNESAADNQALVNPATTPLPAAPRPAIGSGAINRNEVCPSVPIQPALFYLSNTVPKTCEQQTM
jgi:hypothetical protein